MEEYHVKRKIGDGSQGVVYEVEHVHTGKSYALKVMSCTHPAHVNLALREIKVLLQLRHPHIVSYADFFLTFNRSELRAKLTKDSHVSGDPIDVANVAPALQYVAGNDVTAAYRNGTLVTECGDMYATRKALDVRDELQEKATNWIDADEMAVCLVMELCVNGDMSYAILDAKRKMMMTGTHPIAETQILRWISQCVSALLFIHEKGFLHRDLKPTNIFFDNDRNVKIGDFGLAATVGFGRSTTAGTPFYLAPERVLQQRYDGKADIWGVGVIMLELLTLQEQPLNGMILENPSMVTSVIGKKIIKCGFSSALASLVCDMLQRYPEGRPDPQTVLQRLAAFYSPCVSHLSLRVTSPGSSPPAPTQEQQGQLLAGAAHDSTVSDGAIGEAVVVCSGCQGVMHDERCRSYWNCSAPVNCVTHGEYFPRSCSTIPSRLPSREAKPGDEAKSLNEQEIKADEEPVRYADSARAESYDCCSSNTLSCSVGAISLSTALSRRSVRNCANDHAATRRGSRTAYTSILPPAPQVTMQAQSEASRSLEHEGTCVLQHQCINKSSTAVSHNSFDKDSDMRNSNTISNKNGSSKTTHSGISSDTLDAFTLRVPQDYDTLHAALAEATKQQAVRQILVAGGTVVNTCLVLDRSLPDGICLRGSDPAPVIEVAEGGFAVHCVSGKGSMLNFVIRHVGSNHARTRSKPGDPSSSSNNNDSATNKNSTAAVSTTQEVSATERDKSARPTAVRVTGGDWRLHRCHISCLDGSGISVGAPQMTCAATATPSWPHSRSRMPTTSTRRVDAIADKQKVDPHFDMNASYTSHCATTLQTTAASSHDKCDSHHGCSTSYNRLDEDELCRESAPTITQCTFTEVATAGVIIAEHVSGLYKDNTLIGCGFSAFLIKRESAARVCANKICGCGEYGIFCHNGTGVLEENTITENVGCGIVVKGPLAAPIVRKNRIAHNMQAGVLCCDHAEPFIMNNEILNNRHACVIIKDGASPKVINNTIAHGDKAGVYILQCGAGFIEGNTISDNSNAGVLVTTQAQPYVVHNIISGNAYEGIWVCNKGGGTFCNNVICDNVRGMRDIDATSTVTWIDNAAV